MPFLRSAWTLALLPPLLACNGSSTASPESQGAAVATVTPGITWPQSTSANASALSLVGDEAALRRQVDASPVPVLVPAKTKLEAPVLMVEGEYYALSGKLTGASISIQGTRERKRHPDIAPVKGNRKLRGTDGFVTVNEGIRTTSFVENGAGYTVDVECSAPDDARCKDDAFVVALTEELVYVGGRGR